MHSMVAVKAVVAIYILYLHVHLLFFYFYSVLLHNTHIQLRTNAIRLLKCARIVQSLRVLDCVNSQWLDSEVHVPVHLFNLFSFKTKNREYSRRLEPKVHCPGRKIDNQLTCILSQENLKLKLSMLQPKLQLLTLNILDRKEKRSIFYLIRDY